MSKFKQVIHHPAGKVGITVGLAIGMVAALMGEAGKALFFLGLCRLLAKRLER